MLENIFNSIMAVVAVVLITALSFLPAAISIALGLWLFTWMMG